MQKALMRGKVFVLLMFLALIVTHTFSPIPLLKSQAQSVPLGTIQGIVTLTTPLDITKSVVLYKCAETACTKVDAQKLTFGRDRGAQDFAFSVEKGLYRVALEDPSLHATEFVYIFFNPKRAGYNIFSTDCGPAGFVKEIHGDQVCELQDAGVAHFVMCTDASCNEAALYEQYGTKYNARPGDDNCQTPFVQSRCQLNTGVCSVCSLERYFSDDQNKLARQKAIEASQICQGESGGNPFAINRGCMVGGAREYSVGLFQINVLWAGRCPQSPRAPNCSKRDPLLVACRNYYFDTGNNINKMMAMSGNGTAWRPWTVARNCGLTH